MHVKYLKNGFTLIELMLVIAVMGAMVTMGIAAYRQKMLNAKMDQAVLQIQTWLQSGLAYRVNNNHDTWPKTSELVRDQYIKNYSNPWRKCTEKDAQNCFDTATEEKTNNFSVTMYIPQSVPNAAVIADLISKRLPNAKVDSKNGDDLSITASIPLPLSTTAFDNTVIIKGIHTISNDNTDTRMPDRLLDPIETLKCSENREPKRFYSLAEFEGAKNATKIFLGAKTNATEFNGKATITPESISRGIVYSTSSTYSGKVLVIDACVPKEVPKKITTVEPTTSAIFRY